MSHVTAAAVAAAATTAAAAAAAAAAEGGEGWVTGCRTGCPLTPARSFP
jgi:hypothetical protein